MFAIGIAGGTCSGKSTLTGKLENRLCEKKLKIIHMDSYFIKPSPTTVAPITRKVYVEHNAPLSLDVDCIRRDFFAALESDADVVIIEGLLALHFDDIREKLDYKIFVDLQSDERIVRRITRFMSFGQTFEEVTDRYLDTVRYRHDEFVEPTRWHADTVVNGCAGETAADVIEAYIRTKI